MEEIVGGKRAFTPCIYDKIVPIGVKMGVGVFKLQKEDEIKVVLMKTTAYPGDDEVVCFEVDVSVIER